MNDRPPLPSIQPHRSIDRLGTHSGMAPLPPQYPDEEIDLDLRSLWGIVQRHRLTVLGCTLLGLSAALLYNWRTVPIYEASASMRIDPGQGSTASATGTDIFGTDPWNDEIETEMEVLQSRRLADRVADSLKLQVTLSSPRIPRERILADLSVGANAETGRYTLRRTGQGTYVLFNDAGTQLAVVRPGESVAANDLRFTLAPTAKRFAEISLDVRSHASAAGLVQGGLDVRRPHDYANFLEIRYQGADPLLAAAIPNAIAEQFISHRQNEQKSRARSIVAFLREQIDTLSVQLGASEEELRDFRERTQSVNLQAEGESRIGQLAALRSQQDAMQAERVALGRLLRGVESNEPSADALSPSPYRKLMAFPTLLSSSATNTMLSTLVELENQRAQLLSTRTPRNPDVTALSDRIHDIESQLHTIVTTYYEGLGGQVGSLGAALGQGRGELGQIPAKEAEFVRLSRETQLLEEIHSLLETRLKEAQITQAADESSVRIVDVAAVPDGPIKPNRERNLLFGLMLGAMLGFGMAYTRERMDDTVHTRDELQEIARVPVLGLIPRIRNGDLIGDRRRTSRELIGDERRTGNGKSKSSHERGRLIVATDPRHAVAEAFRSLRTNITFSSVDEIPKTLLLTSAKVEDGKTTTAINLTIAFAQQGLRVLLIDADLRKGIIHRIFGKPRSPGVSNLLVEKVDPLATIRAIRPDERTSFDILSTGTLPPNPAELLGSAQMGELIRDLERVYDGIVIDTPPLTLVTDAAVLAMHADGVLVVARAGQTEERALDFAMEQLRNVSAPIIGTILNDIDHRDRRSSAFDYYAYQQDYYASNADKG